VDVERLRITHARGPCRGPLEDKRVRQWIQNTEDGNEVTAATYSRRLDCICRKYGTSRELRKRNNTESFLGTIRNF
jgi:hypothetical protein